MKPSPSKTSKAGGKKRSRAEAAAAATDAAPPLSPPRADPSREWRKLKVKTEDLLTLLNSGFIREKLSKRLRKRRPPRVDWLISPASSVLRP
jgi:hypothetical protein